jgi:hypothetical protein
MSRYDDMKLTTTERAVIDSIGLSGCPFEGLDIVVFSSMEGNHDDLEWIKINDFAQKVIEYARDSEDPMLDEYSEQYEIACEDIVKRAERHAGSYMTSDRYLQEWEYFRELFNEARGAVYKKFQDLQKEGLCIVHEENF